MSTKISNKIVGYSVKKPIDESVQDAIQEPDGAAEIIHMHEKVERPEGLECLEGSTYKIKTPLDEHALYVTINDIILNPGTPQESRRPFEIFINSKNMDHFQWIVALTRVMSAVFRKGGDVTFLAEELQAVFDPRGGYFKAGGKLMPSLVAEIGEVIDHHMRKIGLFQDDTMSERRQQALAEKRAEYEQANPDEKGEANAEGFPKGAMLCTKCNHKAVIIMDNCATCLNCGNSKCG